MKIIESGGFYVGHLENPAVPEKDRAKLMGLTNEEFADELAEMLDEALPIADPVVLFGISPVTANEEQVMVNGVHIPSDLAFEKLKDRNRCFPYICTCGTALEEWSKQYAGDLLAEYWADEIKKYFLIRIRMEFTAWLKDQFKITGHLPSLNPGSIAAWPISGQAELFAALGGREFVEQQIGVIYTPSFLMLPSKSVSGIAFESEAFFENCQYCPIDNCPGRRAKRLTNT